ncbi:TPA: methyltransferase domain-containing protein [Methanosarcina acetivorans]|uniref:Methyltransferase domain-containing protein n=2 Tax=Methanosarcina acetivorans TaxID=2214 RepID=Q8TPV3_METAC|nr:class I SAM-dependent methyltransferase [Methanosarcina acetivorans]AAM05207.1 conserved hypothetical protein [Methanosarcina acetivorans C2A]HIH93916.1 methyltransferase domain-containing protein [Methanosarcina acetivorans]
MYCWNPELYAFSSSAQKSWGIELLTKFPLKGNERVLDVGCGDGKLSAEIAKRLPEGSVLGIDLSEAMVCFAKNHYPKEQFPNLSFMLMDAGNVPFESEFDVIFSNAALHWIKEPKAIETVLKGFLKSLRPEGKLLAQFGGRGNAAEVLLVLNSMLEDEKWSPYFGNFVFPYGFYGPEEYGKWLKNAGFSVRRAELYSKDMTLKGKEGLSGWFASTWHPFTQRVPENLKEEFIDELAVNFIKLHPLDNEGYVHIRMVRLEIEADIEK